MDATLDDVERVLADTFAPHLHCEVRRQLARLEGAPLIVGDAARIKVAALLVADGRFDGLVEAVELGLTDWRDLLVAAFYATEMQPAGPAATLSEAIVVWSGFGEMPAPARDPARLVARFGAVIAADLIPAVRSLEEDFLKSDAVHRVPDLAEAADAAAAEFTQRHPEVSERAVAALAWCYSFDWK